MKKYVLLAGVVLLAAMIVMVLGCSSPMAKAQKLFNEGKYEEVIAQYGSDPNVAAVVTQAKEKVAEKMLTEGKYAAIVEMYPETMAAKEAKNKLAEQLFMQKNYAEVIAKYPDTPWAAQAKMEMDKAAQGGSDVNSGKDGAKKPDDGSKPGGDNMAAKEKAAQVEYDRIMGIKMKDLRVKGLKEFVANPQYAGTAAVKKAQAELSK